MVYPFSRAGFHTKHLLLPLLSICFAFEYPESTLWNSASEIKRHRKIQLRIQVVKTKEKQDQDLKSKEEDHLQQIAKLKQELYLEKELVKKLKQTQEDWGELIEKVQPTIRALSEKIRELRINLHLKNQELNNVLQSLPNGLVVTNLKGEIQSFNRSAATITGMDNDAVIGSSINAVFNHTVLPEDLEENTLELIDRGFEQQFIFKRENGDRIVLKSETSLMRSDENELQGIIINVLDITLLNRLEEEAERKNRLTAMGEIAMQVAHELRNPLGSIELFLSMMKMDFEPDSEEMTLVQHINSATRSMNHIISNLLEYTKPRPITVDSIDLHDILTQFVDFSEFSAEQLNIEIMTDLKAEHSTILGNEELIRQVFQNLFVNACQAMPEGGRLTLSTENTLETDPVIIERLNSNTMKSKDEGQPVMKVNFEDTGKGMPADIRKKIFDPFFSTREQGTGLGLSIVHNTMASHGGTILVDSSENSGTKITLLFPEAQNED